MKNLKKISLIFLILPNRMETGFAVRTKNFTKNKLNQEAEWDTRLRKWLLCQRSILQNGQEAHQNCQQAKYKSSIVVVLKETRAALILMSQSLHLRNKRSIKQQNLQRTWYQKCPCQQGKHQLFLKTEEETNVPTPSQSGVWRRVIKDAENVKNRLKKFISEEEFCLYFDGKRINNKEYQVVCLKNSARTLHLGVLACESGSAKDIFIPLQALLDEYNA